MQKGYNTALFLLLLFIILILSGDRIFVAPEPQPINAEIEKRYISPYVTLSPYDKHFRKAADSLFHCDWKLLAAIAFTESRFDSTALSGVGAKGVMQIMPRTLRGMGIPDTLSGIEKEDIPALAKHAEKEANPLYPVPILLTRKELENFYYQVADWSI